MSLSENEEFAQFAATLTAEAKTSEPAPEANSTETKAPEPEATKVEEKPAEDKPKEAAEKKPDEKKDEKPPEKKVDWRELAAKEKEKRAAKAAAKAAAAQRDAEYAAAREKAAKLDEIMKLSKEKRLAALEKLGMTLDDVNSEYIKDLEENPNRPSPRETAMEKQLGAILDELKTLKEERAKLQEEAKARAQEQAVKDTEAKYFAKAQEAIKAKPDDYELLSRDPKGHEVVFHFIAAHYADTSVFDPKTGELIEPGEELDIHEACRRVEAGLVEQIAPFAGAKKLAAKKPSDTETLSGDVRQPESRQTTATDDDREFQSVALRLLKSQPA